MFDKAKGFGVIAMTMTVSLPKQGVTQKRLRRAVSHHPHQDMGHFSVKIVHSSILAESSYDHIEQRRRQRKRNSLLGSLTFLEGHARELELRSAIQPCRGVVLHYDSSSLSVRQALVPFFGLYCL